MAFGLTDRASRSAWPVRSRSKPDGTGVTAEFTLKEGQHATFVLRHRRPDDDHGPAPVIDAAEDMFRRHGCATGGAGCRDVRIPAAGVKWSSDRHSRSSC